MRGDDRPERLRAIVRELDVLSDAQWQALAEVLRVEACLAVHAGSLSQLQERLEWTAQRVQAGWLDGRGDDLILVVATMELDEVLAPIAAELDPVSAGWLRRLNAVYGDWVGDLVTGSPTSYRSWKRLALVPYTVQDRDREAKQLSLRISRLDGALLELEMTPGALLTMLASIVSSALELPAGHLETVRAGIWDQLADETAALEELIRAHRHDTRPSGQE